MTMATSRYACWPVAAATATMTHTISTPMRSSATTRSGTVGPRSSLKNASTAARANIASAAVVKMSCISVRSTKQLQDAPFESQLDFSSRVVRTADVHHVDVHHAPIVGNIERHAARRQVDQHRQQQDFGVLCDIERKRDDPGLHLKARCRHVERESQVGADELPEKKATQTCNEVRLSDRCRAFEHTSSDQAKQDDIAEKVACGQRAERELTLQGGPGKRE